MAINANATVALPDFGTEPTYCYKCQRALQARVTYHDENTCLESHLRDAEHLHIACGYCGYEYPPTKTADAP